MERFQYLSLWFHDLIKLVITHLNKDHRDRPRDFLSFLEGNLLWKVVQSAFNTTHHVLKSMLTSNLHQWCPLCFGRLMAQLRQVSQRLQSNLSGPLEIYCICRKLSPSWASKKSQRLSNGCGCHPDNLCSNSSFPSVKIVSSSDTACLCLSHKEFRNLLPDRN